MTGFKQRIRAFHDDEHGNALETIMILALAGVIIVALIYFGRGGIRAIGEFLKKIIGIGDEQEDMENLGGP